MTDYPPPGLDTDDPPEYDPGEPDPDETVHPDDHASWARYSGVNDELDEAIHIPPQVARYLLAGETRIIATRQHPIRLIPPALILLGAIVLAAIINAGLETAHHASGGYVTRVWVACCSAGLGWFTYRWLDWRGTWFILTAKRAMSIVSLPRTRVEQLSLAKIKQGDVALEQTFTGRLVGYGSLDFASFATEKALDRVDWLPFPAVLFGEVNRLITPAESVRGPRL